MPETLQLDDIPTVVAENLILIARDNYKLYSLEIKNRQTTLQNIYFWIASALFTVYAAAFQGLFTGKEFIHLGILPAISTDEHKFIVMAAFFFCICVIFTGVDAMRGRGEGQVPILGRAATPLGLLDGYLTTPEITKLDMVRHFLQECEDNGYANGQECERMGRHLRRTSYALLISMFFGLIAFLN